MQIKNTLSYIILGTLGLISCTTPRTVTVTGKVTPRNQGTIGWNAALYVPTATPKYIYKGAESAIADYANKDTVIIDKVVINSNKMLYAYSLDPLKYTNEIYGRFGVYDHVDVGYKYVYGTHVFDTRYQFLGSTNTHDKPSDEKFYGSIGIQYSQNKYELLSKYKINYLQDMMGYKFSRKDILIPLAFSRSFGKEEKYGAISFGAVYGHTFVKYSYLPIKTVKNAETKEDFKGLHAKQHYSSYGMFVTVKGGYRFIYAVVSLATYRQNYGDYILVNEQKFNMKGWTIIPSFGLQCYFGKGILGKG